ncbi:hypothetical protein [Massilia rhizosphaerae]|uniref:hypothetical protein n=1 Tax=Massilia rhizosphaerae TaxID=2784389 RepID=UPI0018DC60EF|nr:hypothetical protein [Massilia rhizosphaerae]
MHFEVPKSKSLKEFGSEYVMIVISILTALALEHTAQAIHHKQLAHEAGEKIEAELRLNAKEVKEVLAHNERDLQQITRVRAELLQGIRDKVADDALMARFKTDWKAGLVLSISLPTLRHEAWDAAVANQAVTWMEDERLQRFATAYATIRDVQALSTNGGVSFLDGPRMMDAESDLETGMATPHEMLKALTQVRSAYGSIDGNMQGLLKDLPKVADTVAAAH